MRTIRGTEQRHPGLCPDPNPKGAHCSSRTLQTSKTRHPARQYSAHLQPSRSTGPEMASSTEWKEWVPGQRQQVPGQKERVPSRRERVPEQTEPDPCQRERVPEQEERIPSQRQQIPGQIERVPSQRERVLGLGGIITSAMYMLSGLQSKQCSAVPPRLCCGVLLPVPVCHCASLPVLCPACFLRCSVPLSLCCSASPCATVNTALGAVGPSSDAVCSVTQSLA